MKRIVFSTLMLLGIAAGAGISPVSAQDKLSVRLDFSPWGVQAAMHLAQNQGWFKQANLDVDIQDGRGSGNTIQLVNAGQADVGQVQVGLVGSARAKGATIRSIATFQHRTDLCILIDKDSPMSKVADLRGKTLVVFAASPWAPFSWSATRGRCWRAAGPPVSIRFAATAARNAISTMPECEKASRKSLKWTAL